MRSYATRRLAFRRRTSAGRKWRNAGTASNIKHICAATSKSAATGAAIVSPLCRSSAARRQTGHASRAGTANRRPEMRTGRGMVPSARPDGYVLLCRLRLSAQPVPIPSARAGRRSSSHRACGGRRAAKAWRVAALPRLRSPISTSGVPFSSSAPLRSALTVWPFRP